MKCPNCNKEIPAGINGCNYCGTWFKNTLGNANPGNIPVSDTGNSWMSDYINEWKTKYFFTPEGKGRIIIFLLCIGFWIMFGLMMWSMGF